jgi:membrane associated rhomboid family serine protease
MRLTIALIALNILVFGYQAALGPAERDLFLLRWAAVPMEIVERNDLEPQVPFPVAGTLLSGLFLHADPLHLATNMALLALFGSMVERRAGGARMLALYLLGGVAGALAQVAANPLSLTLILGASGAIAALMGAAMLLPGRPTLHLVVCSAWAAVQLAAAADALVSARWIAGGLAVWSHLGGLAVGLAAGAWLGRAGAASE